MNNEKIGRFIAQKKKREKFDSGSTGGKVVSFGSRHQQVGTGKIDAGRRNHE